MDNFNNNGISPNPFEKLNETELLFLLEHNKEMLTEAQILDIRAKLNNFQIIKETEKRQELPQVQKVYTKTLPNNRGYVNIIILMLTVWATCISSMFYIFSMLS